MFDQINSVTMNERAVIVMLRETEVTQTMYHKRPNSLWQLKSCIILKVTK